MEKKKPEEEALENLLLYIQTRKLRKTQERETILRTVYNMEDKVSIEDILKKHQELFPQIHICRSTVYNCINVLLKANVIHELKDKNNTVYSKVYGNQNCVELICTKCRETRLTSADQFQPLLENIEFPDFQAHHFRFTLYGTCAKCKISTWDEK